ncbi:MAG: TetR/AcrR family transcriptional regulator [Bacteroidetes bacterium]|nr:MAG: TetR/AcrR family transcriptional regulator [Bacteroidota bacterium]
MGRKAIPRERKNNPEKMGDWTQKLFPYFQKNGLDHVTMDEIADYLGKSKTTLYDYFQTKEELLGVIIDDKLEALRGFAPFLQDEKQDFKTRYMNAVAYLSGELSDITTVFLRDVQKFFPQLWERVVVFIDESTAVLKEFYTKGIDAGIFTSFNVSVLILTDQVFFHSLTSPALLERLNLSVNSAFIEYLNLRFEGLLKTKK